MVNPRGNVSAITLRSCKQVNDLATQFESKKLDGQNRHLSSSSSSTKQKKNKDDGVVPNKPLPISHRVTQSKKVAKVEIDKEILETYRKVEVNIPLVEAIKKIPKYTKFLKELCIRKRRLRGNEKVSLGRNV